MAVIDYLNQGDAWLGIAVGETGDNGRIKSEESIMDKKDSFMSFMYKGRAIHTCFNRTKGIEEVTAELGDFPKPFNSVVGAKIAITKYLKARSICEK